MNILPALQSVYRWQGEICHDTEAKLLIKTRQDKLDGVINTIKEQHSYEVPEIQVVNISAGNPDYFNWMEEVLS